MRFRGSGLVALFSNVVSVIESQTTISPKNATRIFHIFSQTNLV